jgi:alkylation response protein AidB-like acyl-CoA dehydrogenase
LVYGSAWEYDRGKLDPELSPGSEMLPGKGAIEVADEAIEILGGHGCMEENEVVRFYRDARILEIYEGETHKNTMTRFLLGSQKRNENGP